MNLPKSMQGDAWTATTARTIFPILIWCAKNEKTITYSELDKMIVKHGWGHHVFFAKYGYPAGAIGEALIETGKHWGEIIPPLNALIVNNETGIPGDGCEYYIETFLDNIKKRLISKDQKAIAEAVHEKIFNFAKWNMLLKYYNFNPYKPVIALTPNQKNQKNKNKHHGGWSTEGESEEHEILKKYVSENPSILGLTEKLPKGTCEYFLASADKPDVMFKGKNILVAAEVKSVISNDDDLWRGIFQCVKYRAVIRAEQKSRKEVPNGIAVLITQRQLPPSHVKLANLLDISFVVLETIP